MRLSEIKWPSLAGYHLYHGGMGQHRRFKLEQRLYGAPIDVIKALAAAFMLADHINFVLLQGGSHLLRYLGRIAFPLFCLALACHFARGLDQRRYVLVLVSLGLITQPIYATAFSSARANILFTLAIGALLAEALKDESPLRQHAALGFGTVLVLLGGGAVRTGFDFGLAGVFFVTALCLAVARSEAHWLWVIFLTFSLNAVIKGPPGEWWIEGGLNALFAGVGALAVLSLALVVRGYPRFLPRYALHVFYPGHLLALITLRMF